MNVLHNSRKESDFIKRMRNEHRERYIKGRIATLNAAELVPYIKITKHDENYREIHFEIKI